MASPYHYRHRRARLLILALCLGALGSVPPAAAEPIVFPLELMPIEVPSNGAFGVGYRVDDQIGNNGFVFHYVADQGDLFGIYGWPSTAYQYLTCVNDNPAPGEPGHLIPALAEGVVVDASLETGDCFFASNTSQGRLLPDDFDGSGAFVAVRGNINPPHRFGFLHARVDPDGVLRILAGAFQREADVPIETTAEPQKVFEDRFESVAGRLESGSRGDDS